MNSSAQGLKNRSPGRSDAAAMGSSGTSSPLGPSRLLNRTQKRLQRDLTHPTSPAGTEGSSPSVTSTSPTSSLFVTAPDTMPPPMVPTTSLGDPRYVIRPSAKEYTDPTVLTNRSRRDGIVLTPEQAYVRLLRRETKLAQRATTGAGDVSPLSWTTTATTTATTPGTGGSPAAAEATRTGKEAALPPLACEALSSPMGPAHKRTKAKATTTGTRRRADKGGVALSPLMRPPGASGDADADAEDDEEEMDEDDEDDTNVDDDDDGDTEDKTTDYINPFSPSASPKLRAAAQARATETVSLLDALDGVQATWHSAADTLFQALYENGQFQQACAREGVAAFAKELGTVEAVAALPPLAGVREQAQRLSEEVVVLGTGTRRLPSTPTPSPRPGAAQTADTRLGYGGDEAGKADTLRPGSAAYYQTTPWSLLEPRPAEAVTSGTVTANGGLPMSAHDVEREMHMALVETKLRYLVDYEVQHAQDNLRRALRVDGTDTYEATGEF